MSDKDIETKTSRHRQAQGHRYRYRDTKTGTVTATETEARSTTRPKFTRSLISSVPDGPWRRRGASQETTPISQSPHGKKSVNEEDFGARRQAVVKRDLRGKWGAVGWEEF